MGGLYSGALREGHPLETVHPSGLREPVPVASWLGPLRPGDESLLTRCLGDTLDIGCGPGRITLALRERGHVAAGIDLNTEAVLLALGTGATAYRCSVFGDVPRAGQWETALLVDGNVGIGGDPLRLLARVRDLVTAGGQALVEVEGPGAESEQGLLRLASGDLVSGPFPWARLALSDVRHVAAEAGLRADESWQEAGRWFVRLRTV